MDWIPFTPTWLNSGSPNELGNGTLTGRYRQESPSTMNLYLSLIIGSTTVPGSGYWSFGGIPLLARIQNGLPVLAYHATAGPYLGVAFWSQPGILLPWRAGIQGGVSPAPMDGNTPFIWGVGDMLQMQGTYEIT